MQGKPAVAAAARAVLDTDAGWQIRRVARLAAIVFDAALAPVDLTAAQFTMMALVAGHEDDRISALADRAGMDLSSLSRALAGLESRGLVEVAKVERDRRRRAVWLTEQGVRRFLAAEPLWRAAHDRLDPRVVALPLAAIDRILADQEGPNP